MLDVDAGDAVEECPGIIVPMFLGAHDAFTCQRDLVDKLRIHECRNPTSLC